MASPSYGLVYGGIDSTMPIVAMISDGEQHKLVGTDDDVIDSLSDIVDELDDTDAVTAIRETLSHLSYRAVDGPFELEGLDFDQGVRYVQLLHSLT